ncbi:molybdopterin-dependent oxidoreductase [Actinoplanes sp. N902-109]|uniref:molybdopterin-dependent oxidoreductase n=1 Tax=Actinoplanes sp. (strain N902-109) TaxID=649831 RepID=UPI0003293985|nr:molybdopterin-dependent oxidoreductase [Actinoplanes sp. N902-109]AGL20642.1 putative membrane-bound oxidoreductase [Actinoplanes sp. N902-109]
MLRTGKPALIGVLCAALGVAAAELLAAATRPQAGPLVAVGGAVIDAAPTPVKEFAVRTLGTHDKPVLLGSIALVLALFTAAVGIAAFRRRWIAFAGAAVFGVAGAGAALARPVAMPYDAVPSLVGAAIAGFLLYRLARPAREVVVDRRKFLRAALVVGGGALVAGGAAATIKRVRGGAVTRSREAITFPAPADPAKPLPSGVADGFYSTNFYRVDTALSVPRIDVSTWRLRIHGMLGKERTLSFDDLLKRPLIERDITLNCVSNEVGGPYIGTARWLGVPLAPLLRELDLDPAADQLVARSVEGMTIGTPVATVLDGRDAMLVVGMNGKPLPLEHGFPVRMLTPGLFGYAGACKWLDELELTTFADYDAYWVKRGWGARGPVKTASRIDAPKPFAQLDAGTVTVAGVAWAQGRGIRNVEVRVDDRPWQKADLLPVPSSDTWVQWRWAWDATPGPHTLTVRATDGTGAVQTEQRVTPFPDGATGWHSITATVQ